MSQPLLCSKPAATEAVPGDVYREEGRSAHVDSIAKRPIFRQLLDDASRNQFDMVVVHTLDRWARGLVAGKDGQNTNESKPEGSS